MGGGGLKKLYIFYLPPSWRTNICQGESYFDPKYVDLTWFYMVGSRGGSFSKVGSVSGFSGRFYPDPFLSQGSDLDSDPDQHHADPQHWLKYFVFK